MSSTFGLSGAPVPCEGPHPNRPITARTATASVGYAVMIGRVLLTPAPGPDAHSSGPPGDEAVDVQQEDGARGGHEDRPQV
ncbi:MAG TPA: hypothetical protein VGV91_01720, partial [Rubrobacter sp.]|nr:hypothetical protein [Rubrobacter sp.]